MPTSQTDDYLWNINPEILKRWMIGGASAGISLAAVTAAIRAIQDDRERRKRSLPYKDTDENTIVLTLPNKSAACMEAKPSEGDKQGEPGQPKVTDASTAVEIKVKRDGPLHREMHSNGNKQIRRIDGTYGIKAASWQTFTASMLGAGVGGIAGFKLVDTLMRKRHERQLKKELDSARQEYLDMLQKGAGELDVAFQPLEKSAQDRQFYTLDPVLGTAALGLLLGTGGTAYITKKLLDDKFKDDSEERKRRERLARVKRIIFQTAKSASVIDADTEAGDELLKAALAVFLDIGLGEYAVMNRPEVKQALDQRSLTADDMVKLATSDYDILMMKFQSDPELRRLMRNAAADTHPLLKLVPNALREAIIPLREQLDDKVTSGLYDAFGPNAYARRQQLEQMTNFVNQLTATREQGAMTPKQANFGRFMLASMLGETAADALTAQPTVHKTEGESSGLPENPDADLAQMDIVSKDPDAASFVDQNREVIKEVLRSIAAKYKMRAA